MNIFQRHYTKLRKIIQLRKNSRNRAVLQFLQALDFDAVHIRKALLALNGIKPYSLMNGHEISAANFYNTLHDVRKNPLAKTLVADSLGLKPEDLWPEKKEAA